MVVGFCAGAVVRDVYRLNRLLRRGTRETWPEPAARRDQIFASVIGLLLVVSGLAGVVKYHLG
jgi:hypothetical protein